MTEIRVDYRAEPTARRFHHSPAIVRGLRGPFGSGKSVACVQEIVREALSAPAGTDGVRRSRWAVVRNSYPELKSTTIKTWQDWYPEDLAPMRWTSPIECKLELPLEDGTKLYLEILFLALDLPKDVRRLLSLELTGIWFNEAREIGYDLIESGTARVGRYPAKRMLPEGVVQRSPIIMDTNPPDDDHWWYWLFEDEQPRGYEQFVQPPAVLGNGEEDPYRINPDAENLRHQPKGADYWMDMIPGKTREWIKVHLQNEYGTTTSGKAVHPEFNEHVHVAKKDMQPMNGVPLLIGMDMGLTPAVVIGQRTPQGQLRYLDELCADERGTGIRQFVRDVVMPHLRVYYGGPSKTILWGDPAGVERAQTDAETVFDVLREFFPDVRAAPSNRLQPRREALADYLTRMVGGEPALMLSTKCRNLRKALAGKYAYERLQIASVEERYRVQPAKNWYSHVAEASEYLALGLSEHGDDNNRNTPRMRPRGNAGSPTTAGY